MAVGIVSCAFAATAPDRSAHLAWPPPYRYITDVGNSEREAVALGFNLVDIPPQVGALADVPAGARALVWVGNYDNRSCSWQLSDGRLESLLTAEARDPRVAGFYVADEPHTERCPRAPQQLASRSLLIHSLAPHAFTYAVIEDGDSHPGEYAAFRGTVDAVGLDPYPCTFVGGCRYTKIDAAVRRARDAGLSNIWGVIQAFQDGYYRYPSATELREIIRHWRAAGISGEQLFSWSYAGHALQRRTDLIVVLRAANRG